MNGYGHHCFRESFWEGGQLGFLRTVAITFLHFSHTLNSFNRQSGDLYHPGYHFTGPRSVPCAYSYLLPPEARLPFWARTGRKMLHIAQSCCTAWKNCSPAFSSTLLSPASSPTLCFFRIRDFICIQLFPPSIQNQG